MILFLSNGAGEDAIAARIATHLQALRPELELGAFPLVGGGVSYPDWMERYGVVPTAPSGGLSNESWRTLLKDFRSGLLGRLLTQLGTLRRLPTQRLVAVGDLLTVILGGLTGHRPLLFVGTAKSSYHHPYSALERWALRRWSDQVFPRDSKTAQDLCAGRVSAAFLGNAMMDGLEPSGAVSQGKGLAIFPGSREATYQELPRLLEVYWNLRHLEIDGMVALADSIDVERLAAACPAWTLQGDLLKRPGCLPVQLLRGRLGDVLHHCQVALGQAGTAHEQAAGMGLPVVSLHPPNQPLGWYRGRQKGLLGEALWVVPPELAAAALERLFTDPAERERRAAVGRERLGPSGGARRIAEWIAENA